MTTENVWHTMADQTCHSLEEDSHQHTLLASMWEQQPSEAQLVEEMQSKHIRGHHFPGDLAEPL